MNKKLTTNSTNLNAKLILQTEYMYCMKKYFIHNFCWFMSSSFSIIKAWIITKCHCHLTIILYSKCEELCFALLFKFNHPWSQKYRAFPCSNKIKCPSKWLLPWSPVRTDKFSSSPMSSHFSHTTSYIRCWCCWFRCVAIWCTNIRVGWAMNFLSQQDTL